MIVLLVLLVEFAGGGTKVLGIADKLIGGGVVMLVTATGNPTVANCPDGLAISD